MSGLLSVGCCPVRLLSGRVTIQLGYCWANVFRVSVHRTTVCRGCVHEKVSG